MRSPDFSRYSRQTLLPQIGPDGQRGLAAGRAALIGCGALGTVLAGTLVRAGVGHVRLVDRDFIELDNLQRQVLFDEADVVAGLPKAVAAERKLRAINSSVHVEGHVADVNADNIERFCEGASVLLDGTDNFETRFLLNDVAVKHGIPWVYGACVGVEGLVMPILPRDTPCLRCIWEQPPPPGASPTCDTVGVLGPLVQWVASMQAIEALKILMGQKDAIHRRLVSIDAWSGEQRELDMQSAYNDGDCPCCRHGRYEFLEQPAGGRTVSLCGRNSVQVSPPPQTASPDLDLIQRRLPAGVRPVRNEFLLRFEADGLQITLFPDGRAIVKGTADPAVARSTYARYIGA